MYFPKGQRCLKTFCLTWDCWAKGLERSSGEAVQLGGLQCPTWKLSGENEECWRWMVMRKDCTSRPDGNWRHVRCQGDTGGRNWRWGISVTEFQSSKGLERQLKTKAAQGSSFFEGLLGSPHARNRKIHQFHKTRNKVLMDPKLQRQQWRFNGGGGH